MNVHGEVQAPIVGAPIKNNAATSSRRSSVSGGFGLTGVTGVVEGQIKPFIILILQALSSSHSKASTW